MIDGRGEKKSLLFKVESISENEIKIVLISHVLLYVRIIV